MWSLGCDAVQRVWSVGVGELGDAVQRVWSVGAGELGDAVQRVAVKLSARENNHYYH